MGELQTRKLAGIDMGKKALQLSLYDEGLKEMTEESFPLSLNKHDDFIERGLEFLKGYMGANSLTWASFARVTFTMEDCSKENREHLKEMLDERFYHSHELSILSHHRAFTEYVFHQEKAVWDRNTLLLDYSGGRLSCIMVEQLRKTKQKAYKSVLTNIPLTELEQEENPDLDYYFSNFAKHYLTKNPAHIIYLTGDGFQGNWMKRTLTYMCAGRRVFLGPNIYANGACLSQTAPTSFMDEGMVLMQGPEMVCHTVGVVSSEGGKTRYVPITTIGKEWYNTTAEKDIILDRSQKVEFFYHNTRENEIECSVCEITGLPKRPDKTTRIRIRVQFTSETKGLIYLTDLGFGKMYPGTGRVTVYPFDLIS